MNKSDRFILIIGLGFVGQANAISLIDKGFTVFGIDTKKVKNLYKNSNFNKIKVFTHEGFDELLKKDKSLKSKLDVIICVNVQTISRKPFQDLSAAKNALLYARKVSDGVVVLRSTVLPKLVSTLNIDIYMPEFLHQKNAVVECSNPKLIVLGFRKKGNRQIPVFVKKLCKTHTRVFIGSIKEASFIKYISNVFNCIKISYTNEVGDFLKSEGLNPAKSINFLFPDKKYMRYGLGFAGVCLPKDIEAFAREYDSQFLFEVINANISHGKKYKNLKRIYSSD